MEDFFEQLNQNKIIAVVSIPDVNLSVSLAHALIDGGVKLLQINFWNEQAPNALHLIEKENLSIMIGAGTIRSIEQMKSAIANGAKFIISPGLNKNIIKFAQENNITIIPGIDSTYGIEKASELGLSTVSFFPANAMGGISWLKAIKGSYSEMKFVPIGGVTMDNLSDYLSLSNVSGIGGSFLAAERLLTGKRFDEISEVCRNAVNIVKRLTWSKK